MSPAEFARFFDVSRETVDRLEAYAGLLKRWQKTINLVAPNTLDDVWHRHFADSAQLFPLIPENARHLIGIAVDIMSSRIESITNSANVAPADVFTSRALAPLPRLFELVEPLFAPQAVALFLKGRAVADEVEAARGAWEFDLALKQSVTEADARIAVIRHLKRK